MAFRGGPFLAGLTVTDGNGVTSPAAFVTVVVSGAPLVASITARPNPADFGQTVTLSASPSGGNGSYSYAWTLTRPPGSAAALSSPSAPSPTFTADLAGSYLVGLTVTDGNGVTSPAAFVTVVVSGAPLVASITATPNRLTS